MAWCVRSALEAQENAMGRYRINSFLLCMVYEEDFSKIQANAISMCKDHKTFNKCGMGIADETFLQMQI